MRIARAARVYIRAVWPNCRGLAHLRNNCLPHTGLLAPNKRDRQEVTKNSLDTEQAIEGDELRAIKRYLAQREDRLPWLFVSERGQPMTRQAVNHLIRQAGERAGLGRVWPHMLRHSAGYALSNKGHDFRLLQDFMGHRDPRHTSRYTRTASRRFEGLWK